MTLPTSFWVAQGSDRDFEHADEAAHTNPNGENVWRATAWEIHPVTEIRVCPGSPQSCD